MAIDIQKIQNTQWPLPRARLGLIVPSANTLTEPQFNQYFPKDAEIHATRVRIDVTCQRTLDQDLPEIVQAAQLLGDCSSQLILYHCTGMSMGSGMAAEMRMVDAIRKATGIAASSTASGVINAMRALKARRIMLAGPSGAAINALERRFMGEYGIEVLDEIGLELSVPVGMCGATPDVWRDTVLELKDARADAYFITCTNVQSPAAVQELEQRLGKPVVTSNTAGIWYAMRLLGLNDDVPALGRLFRLPLPENAVGQPARTGEALAA